MLISFIIPHYNLPRKELYRCLESIVAQGLPTSEYEILLIDDGSEEPPTWSAHTAILDNKRLIENRHGGPGAARNAGLDKARGKYIQFIDADDALAAGSIARCAELLKSEQPDILRHRYRICTGDNDADTKKKSDGKIKRYSSGAEYFALNNLNGSPCAYMFRRDIAEKHHIRFAENVMHEDEDFNIKTHYFAQQVIETDIVVYHYHIRAGSITASSNPQHEQRRIGDLFALLERVRTFRYEEQETCTMIQRKALDRKLTMLTVDTLLNIYYNGASAEEIEKICHSRLEPMGLYPLPHASYSTKHTIFRILANSLTGKKILRTLLPSQKPRKR